MQWPDAHTEWDTANLATYRVWTVNNFYSLVHESHPIVGVLGVESMPREPGGNLKIANEAIQFAVDVILSDYEVPACSNKRRRVL